MANHLVALSFKRILPISIEKRTLCYNTSDKFFTLEEASVLAGLQFLKVVVCTSFFAFCPSFFSLRSQYVFTWHLLCLLCSCIQDGLFLRELVPCCSTSTHVPWQVPSFPGELRLICATRSLPTRLVGWIPSGEAVEKVFCQWSWLYWTGRGNADVSLIAFTSETLPISVM